MTTREPHSFASLLRRHRVAAGLSQEALAERAGLSPRGVSDLERGVSRTPRLDTLVRLADALGLDPAGREGLVRASGHLGPDQAAVPGPQASQPTGRKRLDANLPGYLTDLLGRYEEELALAGMFEQDHVRLVTLAGPGGVGKTRLAVHVAESLQRAYADGVVFVPLASVTDPGLFVSVVADAVGLSESLETLTVESLARALLGRHLLLVLDNLEQLLAATPNLAALLARCPELQILATSRTRLGISGEHVVTVRPLAVPSHTPALDAASTWTALALFVQRARAVQPAFALTADNIAAVASICRRLDGLPLALELAAARLTTLPPAALLDRLQDPISILTTGTRDAPERHQTLQATLDWSYDLLAEPGRHLLRRLGIFAGEASLEAIQAVCPEWTELEVLDAVSALVDSSFVEPTTVADQPRFSMLETIRDFALQHLRGSGEEHAVRARHLQYLIELAHAAEPHLIGPGQRAWSTRLRREHANVRLALDWAIGHAPAQGLRLATALRFFWYVAGYQRQGCQWLSALLPQVQGADADLARARGLLARGYLRTTLAEYDSAAADLEHALDIGRQCSEPRVIAFAQRFLGVIANTRGDYARARWYLEESLAVYNALGLASDAIVLRMFLGDTALHEGDLAGAQRLFEHCRRLLQAEGNTGTLAYPVRRLAYVAVLRGDLEVGARLYAESLALAREIGHHQGIVTCAVGLADLAARQHQDLEAARLLATVDAHLTSIGARLAYSVDRDQFRQTREVVAARLSTQAFEQAWRQGRGRDLDAALCEAQAR